MGLALSDRCHAPRWASNGLSEEKPLSVPRDAPLQLETCPLTAVDALGNRPAWWGWEGRALVARG